MAAYLDPPLVAREGRVLKVLAICRISTAHQNEKSLADQEASYRRWLDEHTNLPYEMTVLSGQASGESLDRAQYLRAFELVDSRQFDLILTEDLGRICRRVHAHIFAETCQDADTRLIALNDHVDTSREEWSLHSFFAVMRHEAYNKDTGKRIRRTHRNRFSQGVFSSALSSASLSLREPKVKTTCRRIRRPNPSSRSGSAGSRTAPRSLRLPTG